MTTLKNMIDSSTKVRKASLGMLLLMMVSMIVGCAEKSTENIKLVTKPLVVRLKDEIVRDIYLTLPPRSLVEWITLDVGADADLFRLTQVRINDYVATSTTGTYEYDKLYPDDKDPLYDSLSALEAEQRITLRVRYKPSEVPKSGSDKAYVLIRTSKPQAATLSVELSGLVDGICVECFKPTGDPVEYRLKDSDNDGVGDIDLYFCDDDSVPAEVVSNGIVALQDGSFYEGVPYNYTLTNFQSVPKVNNNYPYERDVFVFYPSSDGFVIKPLDESNQQKATVPPFGLKVPRGRNTQLPEYVSVELENTEVVCPVEDGILRCLESEATGIPLIVHTGLVSTSHLSVTNDINLELGNEVCPDFGVWQGSGKFGETSDVTLIGWVEVLPEQKNAVTAFKINNAFLVAVIPLIAQ